MRVYDPTATVHWDPTDAGGARVQPGLYVVKVGLGSVTRTIPLMVLR